ncbi:5-formyltetrahydrofolate cyclo-ligase [Clostridiisalibacter paucivorans]|uniref:5-formyltetrahydrofolate cyclo-ligase n=1 Tax=Clostridiisalibacter paucivorans TaxID=408753 RepID=UPI00068643D5|nr:5-formyltetrahydrofolate cyclo-ligase [Clostridiisalibacter paucivorans]
MRFLEDKATLEKILMARENLTKDQITDYSHRIISTLFKLAVFKESKTLMTYISSDHEVNADEILNNSFESKKKLIVPSIDFEKGNINIINVKNNSELLKNKDKSFFIENDYKIVKKVDINDIDLIILSGLAFDIRGRLIGYRFYKDLINEIKEKPPIIGLAYDFQILNRISSEASIALMDYIITEKRVIVR